MRGLGVLTLYLFVALGSASALCAPAQPISLVVDASDAPRRLLHATLAIPVTPGKLTLVYPRWGIPPSEAPGATVDNIVGLQMKARDRRVEWTRHPGDMFAFDLQVPEGVETLDVSMDVTAPLQRSDMNAATGQLLVLDWQTVVLYPQGSAVGEL